MSRRSIVVRIHRAAALLAFAVILTFWISTVTVELFGSADSVAAVKRAIPWGMLVLVPALATTGATGFRMARGSANATIAAKLRRMKCIAAIGLLVLVPCALYLGAVADHPIDARFHVVQAVELIAGATNLVLMSANIRDGLRLSGRVRASN